MHLRYEVGADFAFGDTCILEHVKDDLKRRFWGGKANTAIAHRLDREFRYGNLVICILPFVLLLLEYLSQYFLCKPKFKDHMQYCNDHSERWIKWLK